MPLSSTGNGPLGRQPSSSGTFQMPQYKPPEWPGRPEYKGSESLDLKKAMTSAVEAELLPDEFNSILGQIGMVNQSERDKALGEYSRELETYKDELGRMEFERGEEAAEKKSAIEIIEKQRRYGLDLAKEARETQGVLRKERTGLRKEAAEALGAERKHGLEVGKLGIEREKLGIEREKLGVPSRKEKVALEKEERVSTRKLKAADKKQLRTLKKELRTAKQVFAKEQGLGVEGKPTYDQARNNVQAIEAEINDLTGKTKPDEGKADDQIAEILKQNGFAVTSENIAKFREQN